MTMRQASSFSYGWSATVIVISQLAEAAQPITPVHCVRSAKGVRKFPHEYQRSVDNWLFV